MCECVNSRPIVDRKLTNSRPIYRPIYRSTVGRCISRYVHIYRLTVGRYIGPLLADLSVDSRPIYRPICRPRPPIVHMIHLIHATQANGDFRAPISLFGYSQQVLVFIAAPAAPMGNMKRILCSDSAQIPRRKNIKFVIFLTNSGIKSQKAAEDSQIKVIINDSGGFMCYSEFLLDLHFCFLIITEFVIL